MSKKYLALALLVGIGLATTLNTAYGQETAPLEVELRTSDIAVIAIGIMGGLVNAFMAWNKVRKANIANHLPAKFDPTLFLNKVLFATITSIPIAIATSLQQTELTLFTMFLIFTACIGTSQLISNARTKSK
ncbi:MAG: putative membrane protein [Cenarchaeum symbiont of Oopsacas minuta]|nr:putative membrane protein [Cenarchaeum symbiont of Oopsacas minuta]